VEREREVRAFVKQEYWTLDANLEAKKKPVFDARLFRKGEEGPEIADQAGADAVIADIEGAPFIVRTVGTKEKKRNPVAPFITSTLQQDSSRKLRFSVKRTMMLAQQLYEGIELGAEGSVGLITYMRTDSTRIGEEALAEVRQFIGGKFGVQYLPASPNLYKSKKDAQDAHEAVRPSSATRTPDDVAPFLAEDQLKLYRLIWMRFVASQMNPAIFDQTTIDLAVPGKSRTEYTFRATGSVQKFDGFLAVYEEGKDQKDEEDEELKHKLPAVTEGEEMKLRALKPEQHFTEPPARYTEATLVKKLESDGVGRPSTYASILSTIQEREYVTKEGGKFKPTELGMVVTDLLLESFADIFDVRYTARMEEELDDIEEGKVDWRDALGGFYERFMTDLGNAETNMTNIKRMEKPTDLLCDKCGKPLVIKWGKHGSFLACTGYPECTYTRELAVDLPDIDGADLAEQGDEEYCQNCGRPMVLKKGRFGTFFACSGYPDCKTTKQIGGAQKKSDVILDEKCPQCENNLVQKFGRFGEFTACSNYPACKYVKQKTIGVKCPECSEGDVVERRSKRGKTFFGCSRYPDCAFVAWAKPVPEKCPDCGSPYLTEKYLKAGAFLQCPAAGCKYKREFQPEQTAQPEAAEPVAV
jgi:DNA topoisomerase I